jgi:hypothetical protein
MPITVDRAWSASGWCFVYFDEYKVPICLVDAKLQYLAVNFGCGHITCKEDSSSAGGC